MVAAWNAQYMIEIRGTERKSMITGSSVHNQRIEGLWRDMHRSIMVLYYKLFYFMEHHDILNQFNKYHLWALHYAHMCFFALNQQGLRRIF